MNNKSKKVGLAVLAPLTMIIMSGAVLAQQDPMITFRFDDGLIGQYGYARPILAKYDFPAVDYIFTDPLEEGDWIGYMNWSQVEELQNVYGWEIGGHTKSHPHLTKLSDSKLIEELSESKAILESHGLLIKGFASPFGEYDDRVLSYIARYYENHGSAWPYDFNTYPFNDYAIVVQEARNSTSVATAKGWIDEAASSGKWLVLLFHEIVQSNPSEYEYTKDNFEAVVDYVKAKDIPVVTITDALKILSPNLALNHSFESATSGWADNWERTSTNNITLDTENNGCSPNSKNSIKFTGGTSTYSLYTKDFIDIDPTKVYPLKVFFNCSSFTSGGVDVFIDEYDSSGNWFSWKWQTGIWSPYVGYQIIAYVPSQNTDKILVWIEGVAKSNLTCYVDDVVLEGDSLPTPNNSPILTAEIPDQSFNEDTSLTNAFDLDNYFSDPDKDPLIYSYSGATNIMVSINLDGTVDFSASPNWSGVESITLTASDGLLTAQDTILVTVNPINDAPTITSTPGLIATTGVEYLYDIEVVDPDGDTITYSLTVYPAGMIIDANTGLISWIPSSDQIGDHNVKTEVSDGFLPDTQNWTIAVSETPVPNNSPILIQNIPDQSFDEDTTLINVFDLDDYFSDPDGDSLNYSASGANNITATINPDGTVDFSASQDWNGQENITFAASDGSLSAQDTILVTVNPVDDKPTIISTPGTAAIQDLEYVYDVEAADADGDVLVYSLITSPAGMIIDANTGLINWTPTADQLGDHNVEVKVSDGFLDDNQNWTITVSEESQNLVLNPSFEEVTNNWADYWERLDSQNIILDANNNGAAPNPKNSLKFIGGSQTYSVYAKEFIEVDPTKTYLFKAYFNCQNFTSGGVDIFFDEHDQSGNWLDWTWQTGIWNSYVGQKSVIYTPNPNTKKLLIWIEGVAGSNLTCYVDNIILEEQS